MGRNIVTETLAAARMVTLVLAALVTPSAVPVTAQTRIDQFFDNEYDYSFEYPSDWPIRKLPEGEADKTVRVTLQGPNGSSFTVVVEKADKKTTKEEFQGNPQRKEVVEAMMRDTIEQVYKAISRNIRANHMTVGEQRDLSSEKAIKFYIATRNAVSDEKSVIVAGIHAFPFAKDYSVNFLMTAFLTKTTNADIDALKFVFNSFHFGDEPSVLETQPGPAAKAPATVAPKP